MQIPFTLGTGTDENADPIDRLPVNFLYTPKPNFEYMDMTPGLTRLAEGVGVDRGGAYIQTDKLKGQFRVSGDKLIKLEGDKVTIIDTHKIKSFKLEVSTDRKNLMIGQSTTIKATSSGGESLGDIEWIIDNEDVAKITPIGNECSVKGVWGGNAKVTAKLKDANDEIEISVDISVTSALIVINQSDTIIKKDEKLNIVASIQGFIGDKNVTWSTSNESIASIVSSGNIVEVSAKGIGSSIISASYDGQEKISDSIKITVTESDYPKVQIDELINDLKIGESKTIKAFLKFGSESDVVNWSKDGDAIEITPNGNKVDVKAVKYGYAFVNASYTKEGKTSQSSSSFYAITNENDGPPANGFDEEKESKDSEVKNIRIDGDGVCILTPTNNNLSITTGKTQYLYSEKYGLRPNPAKNIQSPKDTAFMNDRLIDITYDSETDITYIVQHAAGEDDVIKPLAYGTSDARSDEIVGIGYVTGNRVAVFNRFSIEFFRDDGNETTTKQFTLIREEGRAIDGGLSSTNLKTPFAGGWALIGGKKNQQINVHIAQPGTLNPIGTSEIQNLLSTYTQDELDNSWLESKEVDGHVLLICQLTRHTLQFDASTQQWSTLKTGLFNDVWRASHGVYDPIQSKWIYGDKHGSSICYSDKSTFSQYGDQQEAILYTPMMPMYNQIINLMQIRTIAGRYPQGYKQNCFVSHSVLGGQAFGNENIKEVAMGMTPDQRFLLRGLGMVNGDIGFKVRFATNYPTGISASMEIQ